MSKSIVACCTKTPLRSYNNLFISNYDTEKTPKQTFYVHSASDAAHSLVHSISTENMLGGVKEEAGKKENERE